MAVAKLVCTVTGSDAGDLDAIKAWVTQEGFAKKVFAVDAGELSDDAKAALAAARGTDALEPKVVGKDNSVVAKFSAWLCALDVFLQAHADGKVPEGESATAPADAVESQSCVIM